MTVQRETITIKAAARCIKCTADRQDVEYTYEWEKKTTTNNDGYMQVRGGIVIVFLRFVLYEFIVKSRFSFQ